MPRSLLAVAVLFALPAWAHAQDMPLSQILIEGEGWKKTSGSRVNLVKHGRQKQENGTSRDVINYRDQTYTLQLGASPSEPLITAAFIARTGATVYIGHDRGDIWAYQVDDGGRLNFGAPYCSVQADPQRWKGNPAEKPSHISAITGDRDGRIYAATRWGVEVFDPTGRLCGTLTRAAEGTVQDMMFEGDKLVLWINEQKYERKLNTSGLKP